MTIHKTSDGKPFNMEEFIAKNEHVIALGNMKVNAKGDVIGKNGKVIETSQQRTQKHYANTVTTCNNTSSLKGSLDAELEEVETKAKTQTKAKSKTVKPKEIELEDGSIEVLDPETDEGNNI